MVNLRRVAVLLLVVALVLAIGVGVAGAKKKKHKKKKGGTWASQVTLTLPTATHFEGTVTSQLRNCRGQRLVTVYYTEPSTGQVLALSVQRTNSDGRYAFDVPSPAYAGTYKAVLIDERIKPKDVPQTCKGAESLPITVGGTAA
jgi:Na+-translocating ferredoxin:NAD+ oxidoreductase RnfG subunit